MPSKRTRADYRRPLPEAYEALTRLKALSDLAATPERDAAASAFGALIGALGYDSYALGLFLTEAGATTGGVLALGEGAMRAAAEAYLRDGLSTGDPIAQRLATAQQGFTLERYFAHPVDRDPGGTLAAIVANFRAHGLRNIAMTPIAGPLGAPHGALALAGPSDLAPDDFAALFRETGWLAALAAATITARLHGPASADAPTLTASERQVVGALAEGLRPGEIALRLGKSERTVRNQIDSAKRRLGTGTNAGLVAAAIRLGLIRI